MWNKNLSFLLILLLSVSCQKDMLTWDLERLPEVEIIAESVSANEVRITYEVISESPVGAFTVYWDEEPNPGNRSHKKEMHQVAETGEILITGLCEESQYYFVAEVKNDVGKNLSNETEATTLALTGEPILAFNADTTQIYPGESVNFSNLSTQVSCQAEWEWYVNDSLFSTDFNSSLTLTKTGAYSVSLLLKSFSGETFELIKIDYISVSFQLNFEASSSEILLGDLVDFEVLSPHSLATFSWEFGDGAGASSASNPSYLYTEAGVYSVSLSSCDQFSNCATYTIEDYISVNPPCYPDGSVHCNNNMATEAAVVMNPQTGKLWMDRNLGASQVASSLTDEDSYGDLYQWGRFSDGHQCRNSSTTSTLSSSDTPGHSDFILNNGDWHNPQNNNLWQGMYGMNNPCPSGFRLPTEAELVTESQSWNSNNSAGAFGSPLKLTAAGGRVNSSGGLFAVGSGGRYWSSTVPGSNARYLAFASSSVSMDGNRRAYGYSVRCIKD